MVRQSSGCAGHYPECVHQACPLHRLFPLRLRQGGAAAGDGLDPEQAEAPVAACPIAEQKVYARQVLDRIRALPEREREAVYLVFGEGLSHREAATAMTCQESTVSWYIHEARKKLQPLREPRPESHGEKERRHG